jgi:hypothetical protein
LEWQRLAPVLCVCVCVCGENEPMCPESSSVTLSVLMMCRFVICTSIFCLNLPLVVMYSTVVSLKLVYTCTYCSICFSECTYCLFRVGCECCMWGRNTDFQFFLHEILPVTTKIVFRFQASPGEISGRPSGAADRFMALYFGFPLSVSLCQCSVLIFSHVDDLTRTNWRSLGTFQKVVRFLDIG